MGKIQKTFIKNLKYWVDTEYKGTITDLAKQFGVSQGYLSNMLGGLYCKDETWRRMVANHIGMDYDTMIGIPKPESDGMVHIESRLDKDHFDVTKKFKNKELAIEINQIMVEIERINPSELAFMKTAAKIKLSEVSEREGPDKALGEDKNGTAS